MSQPVSIASLPPLQVVPPKVMDGYLIAAESLFPGIEILFQKTPAADRALNFLCGQVAECLLKCYISSVSEADKNLRNASVGHKLDTLWGLAHANGLAVNLEIPNWLRILSNNHSSPYPLRYMERINGISLPPTQELMNGIIELRVLVKKAIEPSLPF